MNYALNFDEKSTTGDDLRVIKETNNAMHNEKPQQNIDKIYELHFNVDLASAEDLKDMVGSNDANDKISKTNLSDEESTIDKAILQMKWNILKFMTKFIVKVKDLTDTRRQKV